MCTRCLVEKPVNRRSSDWHQADAFCTWQPTGSFLGDECGTPLDGTRAVGGLVATNGAKPTPARSPRVQTLPENPLLLSGLAFAGANRRTAAGPQEDDGILTAEELRR